MGDGIVAETLPFYTLTYTQCFRAVELASATSEPRRVEVRRVIPMVEADPSNSVDLPIFQRAVAGHASMTGGLTPRLLHAFGRNGRAHAMVLEHLEGIALHDVVRWLHELGEGLPVPVAMAVARTLVHMWELAGSTRPQVRLRDVIISPAGHVRARVVLRKERYGGSATGFFEDTEYMRYYSHAHMMGARNPSEPHKLGALLYEMLVGHLPIRDQARSFSELVYLVMDGAPFPPIRTLRPDLPAAVTGLVDRAVARDSSDGFATWSEMARALEALPSSAAPMEPEDLAAWLQSLPTELRLTEPPLDLATRGEWHGLPRLDYEPVRVPPRKTADHGA